MKMRRLVSIICILAMLNASILSAYGAVEANHQCHDEGEVFYAETAMEYFDPDDKSDLAEPISFFAYRDLYQGSYGSELSDTQKEYYDLLVETYLDAETEMPNGNSAELSFAPSEKIKLTIDPTTQEPTEEGQLVINALYEDIVYGYYAFVHDYPEVFWAGGVQYGCGYSYYTTGEGWITTIRIIPQERYTGAAAQSEAFASGVDEAVAEVKEMRTSDNVYYTIKAAHDYLCEKVTYNYDAVKDPDNHTYAHSCGPVFTETAPSVVCEGYGKAFKVLCDAFDIPCANIIGEANGGGHLWNYVQIDENWYAVDVTWDDQTSIIYNWFLVGADGMTDHTALNNKFAGNSAITFVYPTLNDTAYVYVEKQDYDMSGVSIVDKTVTYDGTTKSLAISGTLPEGVTVDYANNEQIHAGTYQVTASFTGDTVNYNKIPSMTATLTIEPKSIETVAVEGIENKTHTGSALTQNITVKDRNQILTDGTDYTVSYTDNINVGTATVIVKGIGNYKDEIRKTFNIEKAPCSHDWIEATCTTAKTCQLCGEVEGEALGHNWKTATCTEAKTCQRCGVTEGAALGHNYSKTYTVDKQATTSADGSQSKHCTRSSCDAKIDATAIPKIASQKLSTTKYSYSGSTKKPTITVKDSAGNELVNGTDYTLPTSYGKKSVGRYAVTITYKGKYTGKTTLYFTIVPKAPASASANLSSASQTSGYDDIKFKWDASTGASGYNVYYKKSSASSYTFYKAVTGTSVTKKNLSDGVKYVFKVVPYFEDEDGTKYSSTKQYKTASVYTLKKVSQPTVTKSGTKVKVKWKNICGETGYQISRSISKTGTKIVATYKTTSGTCKTVSATKGKIYYYKVRAYKVVDGKKIYGPWSEVKKYKR